MARRQGDLSQTVPNPLPCGKRVYLWQTSTRVCDALCTSACRKYAHSNVWITVVARLLICLHTIDRREDMYRMYGVVGRSMMPFSIGKAGKTGSFSDTLRKETRSGGITCLTLSPQTDDGSILHISNKSVWHTESKACAMFAPTFVRLTGTVSR